MLRLRDMQPADVGCVAEIEARAFTDAWPAAAFTDLLAHDYARLRVAVDAEGAVVGYCVLLRAADEGEIANICCAPAARARGIGGLLLDDALTAADASGIASTYLEVRPSNTPARRLYDRRGFVQVGRRRNYYQTPTEDALVLRRTRPSTVIPSA